MSEVARELGRRGGEKTRDEQRKKNPDYYRRLNKLSLEAKRKKKQLEN